MAGITNKTDLHTEDRSVFFGMRYFYSNVFYNGSLRPLYMEQDKTLRLQGDVSVALLLFFVVIQSSKTVWRLIQ